MDNSIRIDTGTSKEYGTIKLGDYVAFDIYRSFPLVRFGKVIKIESKSDEITIEEPGGHIVVRRCLFDYNNGSLRKVLPYENMELKISKERVKGMGGLRYGRY